LLDSVSEALAVAAADRGRCGDLLRTGLAVVAWTMALSPVRPLLNGSARTL
jgi:hypothetical protein